MKLFSLLPNRLIHLACNSPNIMAFTAILVDGEMDADLLGFEHPASPV